MASKERFSEDYNDVEYPIEIKEEKIEIVDHLDEDCMYRFKSGSDNMYKNTEIQVSSDVLSIKNNPNPLIACQLVSTESDISCKNIKSEGGENERNNESANKVEGTRDLAPLGKNLVVEINGGNRENSSRSCQISCSKEKQAMRNNLSGERKTTNDPENVFSTSTLQIEINPQAVIYECMLCESHFSSHSDLKEHAVIHLGDVRYECDICAYKSTDKDSLTRHRRIHIQERPFQCNLCRYKCTKDSYLKMHMCIHTKEKPFRCETCGYKCTTKSYMRKHVATHMKKHLPTKPRFQCGVCGCICACRSSLNKHMRTHTSEKSFHCAVCGFKCSFEWSLIMHMRIHTRENLKDVKQET